MKITLSCRKSTPVSNPIKTQTEIAAEYWRKHENDGQGCSVGELIDQFGCEIAAPLLIHSMKHNTNTYVRANIIWVSSLLFPQQDTNACLFALYGLGLRDKEPKVRKEAWEAIQSVKEELEKHSEPTVPQYPEGRFAYPLELCPKRSNREKSNTVLTPTP
ncbi:MAG: HEAT repeat domain-containing protein [Kiritimatiellae bacterium]|jgi:hypothetical protein|nr:HEAT repeat domain-containing protein [Kiritimatiellia bacterium]